LERCFSRKGRPPKRSALSEDYLVSLKTIGRAVHLIKRTTGRIVKWALADWDAYRNNILVLELDDFHLSLGILFHWFPSFREKILYVKQFLHRITRKKGLPENRTQDII
jgi:hypothetical protein